MRVLLHGCNGKMGQVMTRVIAETPDMEIVSGVDKTAPHASGFGGDQGVNLYPVYGSLEDATAAAGAGFADILIDFSHHTALDSLLAFGIERNVPLLICTTGFTPEEKARMKEASSRIPILNSANMSLGVNLLLSLVKQAALLLHDTFDIEIIEKHHNQKVDAPSGTALMIADAIGDALDDSAGVNAEYVFGRHSKNERRQKNQIGIHAVRGGAIVGEHNVVFAGQGEVVEISHTALSRDVFAYGAVNAARFLARQKPGLYSMKDVILG